jgi:hypothetical protein
MRFTSYLFYFVLLFVFAAVGCKRRPLPIPTATKTPIPAEVLNIKNNDFIYFSGKAKVAFQSPEQNMTVQTTIRIKKDSLIWISVSPGLGIEVVRCLFNQEKVFVVDKFNKKNYEITYDSLSRQFNFPINFQLFQALLVGNSIYSPEQAVNMTQDTTYFTLFYEKEQVKLQQFIAKNSQRLEKIEAVETANKTFLQVLHTVFEEKEHNRFPKKSEIKTIASDNKTIQLQIQYTRIETSNIAPDLSF